MHQTEALNLLNNNTYYIAQHLYFIAQVLPVKGFIRRFFYQINNQDVTPRAIRGWYRSETSKQLYEKRKKFILNLTLAPDNRN